MVWEESILFELEDIAFSVFIRRLSKIVMYGELDIIRYLKRYWFLRRWG